MEEKREFNNKNMRNIPLVAIYMVTYNHEKYIAQAIESVVSQQTDFDIRLIICEDFSTDRTRDICISFKEKFNDKIDLVFNNPNIGAIQNGLQAFKLCLESGAKYIAILEGDDYWIDPLKLQKQVDFLELNPDFGLVHTNLERIENGKITEHWQAGNIPSGFVFEKLLTQEISIATLTICMRRELLEESLNVYSKQVNIRNWKTGDYPIWLQCSLIAKFAYFNDKTAFYRTVEGSMTRNNDKKKQFELIKSVFDIQKFFMDRENVDAKIKNKIECVFHSKSIRFAFSLGDKKLAREDYEFLKAHGYHPQNYKVGLLFLAVKSHFIWQMLKILKNVGI